METISQILIKTIFFQIILIIIFLFSSCSHYYYAPNSQNVPLFHEKGKLRLSGVKGYGTYHKSIELQSALSVSDKIGIMANGFIAKGGDKYESNYGEGTYYEAGCGYFKPIGKKFVFETYGGMGLGNVKNYYEDHGYSDLDFNKYFLQPSFGLTTKYFDVALSARFCGLYYNNIFNRSIQDERENIEYIIANRFSYLFERALTLRMGWKDLKIQIQYGYSTNMSYPKYPMDEFNFNLGLYLAL